MAFSVHEYSRASDGRKCIELDWPSEKVSEIRRQVDRLGPSDNALEAMLATASLKVATGDAAGAVGLVFGAVEEYSAADCLDDRGLVPIVAALFTIQRLEVAAAFVRNFFRLTCDLEFEFVEQGPGPGCIYWDILLPERMRFNFHPALISKYPPRTRVSIFLGMFALFARFAEGRPSEQGTVVVNLEDHGLVPGITSCDNRPDYFLVPDTHYLISQGYKIVRQELIQHDVAWEERKPIAFWRGATTGHPTDRALGWRSLPRVRLCELAKAHSDSMDAGITVAWPVTDQGDPDEIRKAGLMREYVPPKEFLRYRYQIDIDGNTNSWPGLFSKLLTGCPVLKVASPTGHRQWYYDRLKPWINYVPVATDMSDLVERVEWLKAHDCEARRIGELGRELAMSLEFETELKRASATISAALRYAAAVPEIVLDFTVAGGGLPFVREGWYPPERDGVVARGRESRLELPKPIARQDFILSVDVSPCEGLDGRVQRVALVVNGTILFQALISKHQALKCRLPLNLLEDSETLTISILHPDATPAASSERPLDDRLLSIKVQRLTLTPLALYTGEPVAPSAFASLSQRTQACDLYCPDVWLPSDVELWRVVTCHNTVLFADIANGRLRHGPMDTSPQNLFAAVNGSSTSLLHVTSAGERFSVRLSPQGKNDDEMRFAELSGQKYRLIAIENGDQPTFALSNQGIFLCAEIDGQVTLSRLQVGPWERFHFVRQLSRIP